MTYEVLPDKVLWLGKSVKKTDPASFEILHGKIGRDAEKVFFGASLAKVHAGSFEILNDGYARDNDAAYEILQTKLKPIKKADAATFVALGVAYAKDKRTAFFRDKPLRKCVLAELRSLSTCVATDGERLFWTNSPLALPTGPLNAANLSVRLDEQYEVNRPAIILHDGVQVYYMPDRNEEWIHVVAADPASFEIIEERLNHYQRDKNHVYYRGVVIDGADAATVHMLGYHVVGCANGLWCGSIRLDTPFSAHDASASKPKTIETVIDPAAFEWIDDEFYHDEKHIWKMFAPWRADDLPTITLAAECIAPAENITSALETAWRKVCSIMFPVFDAYVPLEMGTNELAQDWKKHEPGEYSGLPEFSLTCIDGIVETRVGTSTIMRAPASAWMSHASALWAHTSGRRDRLIVYPQVGYMLPDGDELLKLVIAHAEVELIAFANALHATGDITEAQAIAHQLLYRMRGTSDAEPETLARYATPLLKFARYEERHHEFTTTTNLAVARHVIETAMLQDEDFRVRLEACRLLHGCMASTSQNERFIQEIIPQVVARIEAEPIGAVREMLLAVIECALVCGFRTNKTLDGYATMQTLVQSQLQHAVNVDLNRARLIEILWATGSEGEAEKQTAALLADTGDQRAPPMYSSHYAYRSYRLWVLAARLRVAGLQHEAGKLPAGRGKELKAERDRLFTYYKKPKKWWEFEEIDQMFE